MPNLYKTKDRQTGELKKITGPEENARRKCFKKLFGQFLNQTENLQGLVFERRKKHEDNDRDKSFFNILKKDGYVPDLSRVWVSPYDGVALWVPKGKGS
ncbi:hypothetical protein [Corynebacterium diphtheriae]|uniref:hypothetical protein n=1 Tax=Corynebacterium diphtheriae TaxID=1717 RepID=UPI0005A052C2|nr:hypothetical protein [Corynebacterium diphtheriae]MCM0017432.1 hypothetical protein [Corynebacterium diphtheriae bv. mitis]MCM0027141.1 hypothetical protein [Corynebacterium diphtheriae bv. mitis]MCM0029596.1 hypothetical protein [Corynebacterium diphtheriae bv. mitis]MCM0038049.1 hypothetical protein [Corynebacterium diphtheriae bv. mitis]MCM0041018.1 hypothetical protein [Corynebacterium diphtheriae bv. mitis]